MDTVSKLFVVAILSIVGLVGYAGYSGSKNNTDYRAVCKLNGGTPAHNGRHWECLGANK